LRGGHDDTETAIMEYFHFGVRDGRLHCEEVPVARIAERVGTPAYVYSRHTLERHFTSLRDAFQDVETLICFSVKSLANLAICQVLKEMGAGFDVVSGGEIFRALQAGSHPQKIVFAGVGKTPDEIAFALDYKILMFNVESESELRTIERVAKEKGLTADIALRINPDVDPKTHTYITTGKKESKFGIDLETAGRLAAAITDMEHVRMVGVHAHIGSQITEVEPYTQALTKSIRFADEAKARGNPVEWINIGGGFGIYYRGGDARPARDYADILVPMLASTGYRLIIEPGRFIAGNAGILLTRVIYVKRSGEKRFLICDAAMNDLLRPSLYSAHHEVWPVESKYVMGSDEAAAVATPADVVGPICESGDFIAKDRMLPPIEEGELLAVFSAGAYGMVMSSNYNSRPRPAEVLVSGDLFDVIRARETLDDLIRGERTVARWD
jgi:diaminopimelate decarboxylase